MVDIFLQGQEVSAGRKWFSEWVWGWLIMIHQSVKVTHKFWMIHSWLTSWLPHAVNMWMYVCEQNSFKWRIETNQTTQTMCYVYRCVCWKFTVFEYCSYLHDQGSLMYSRQKSKMQEQMFEQALPLEGLPLEIFRIHQSCRFVLFKNIYTLQKLLLKHYPPFCDDGEIHWCSHRQTCTPQHTGDPHPTHIQMHTHFKPLKRDQISRLFEGGIIHYMNTIIAFIIRGNFSNTKWSIQWHLLPQSTLELSALLATVVQCLRNTFCTFVFRCFYGH